MDRATPALDSLHAIEMRVLDGPQRGACAALAVGVARMLVAQPEDHAEGADIVLRDEQCAPARVRVTADTPHALLEVLDGEVRLGDQVITTGARVAWMMHTPLQIGRSVIAFGRASLDEWPLGGEAPSVAAEKLTASAVPAPATPRRRAEVWLASMGAALVLISTGTLWIAHVAAAPHPEISAEAAPLAVALQSSEFAALNALTHADGQLALHGRLSTMAQRARLDAWLAKRQYTPAVNVLVDENIVRDVAEVFRVNGVTVQARVAGPGRIAAQASERDSERLARAEEVVRRDVRGLDHLSVRNTVTPRPSPAVPMADDPGKRISSVVPGDPAYLVTADGARYFVGALLPSGHRITQIAQQRVTVDRDGHTTILNF